MLWLSALYTPAHSGQQWQDVVTFMLPDTCGWKKFTTQIDYSTADLPNITHAQQFA